MKDWPILLWLPSVHSLLWTLCQHLTVWSIVDPSMVNRPRAQCASDRWLHAEGGLPSLKPMALSFTREWNFQSKKSYQHCLWRGWSGMSRFYLLLGVFIDHHKKIYFRKWIGIIQVMLVFSKYWITLQIGHKDLFFLYDFPRLVLKIWVSWKFWSWLTPACVWLFDLSCPSLWLAANHFSGSIALSHHLQVSWIQLPVEALEMRFIEWLCY